MADEYISKQAFNNAIREAVRKCPNTFYNGLEVARQIAHDMDAADVRSVVHAEWILVGRNLDGTSDFECSACLGMLVDVPDDDEHDLCAFCPNCGADMRTSEEP